MRKAVPLVFILTLLWGTNWPLFPIAVREVSVWTFRAVALLGAGLVLLAVARVRGESLRIARADWGTLLAASLTYLVVWNVASTYSAILIPSGQAAILGFTMPLWGALLAWAFLKQRPGARVLLALAVGGLGVVLLIVNGIDAYAKAPLGFALGLLAGLGWAAGTLILKRRPIAASPLVLTGWQLLVAGVPPRRRCLLVQRRWLVHALAHEPARHRVHHTGAHVHRQPRLVRHRRPATREHRRAVLRHGPGGGDGGRRPRPRRATGPGAMGVDAVLRSGYGPGVAPARSRSVLGDIARGFDHGLRVTDVTSVWLLNRSLCLAVGGRRPGSA